MFSKILVVAITTLPLVAQALVSRAATPQCARHYTVVEGDTCDSISHKESVSTFQLATVNPVINAACSNLMPGQSLCLGTQGEDCTDVVVVQSGDTCDSIAECAGVNATILLHNNPNINTQCTNIYVGEVLCVLSEVRAPPPSGNMPIPSPASGFGTATAAPVPPHTTAFAPAQTSTVDSTHTNNGGDDNLPFCDEMDGDE